MKLWDPRGYLRELSSGNVGVRHFARVMSRAVVREPMRKLGLIDEVHVRGSAKKGDSFPALELQPGERVRVKSREEIARTLNEQGRNKGLWFDEEMLPYCGQEFRVRQRVRTFINDQDGKMVELKNEAITLEGVVCSGNHSLRRWFCSREIYPYWRECWLERVEYDGRGARAGAGAGGGEGAESDHQLPAVERLGQAVRGGALHPADPRHRPEQVGGEPGLARLGGEGLQHQGDLPLQRRRGERDEEVREFRSRRRTSGSRTRGSGGCARCSRSARSPAGGPGAGRRGSG